MRGRDGAPVEVRSASAASGTKGEVTMEFRWNGPQMVNNLGDNPPKSAVNSLFAIPGSTKSDSSLPHHDVSSDGHVGAADKDGCTAAIEALNGSRGGVSASATEKAKAFSHLASHLRALGVDPPAKQFAAPQLTERRAWCQSLRGIPERIDMTLGGMGVEMRAKPNGTGGTAYRFDGYAAVFDYAFEMWDPWGDQFTEVVNQGACTRTLANNCDVPFLIGHNSAGFSLARTRSGTMTLGQDSHGVHVGCPDLDGSLEMVRQLYSAVQRGDMDEMSLAFIALQQVWSPDYLQRNITEMDLHKGDVSVVVFGANDGTAGNSMTAVPVESLTLRRPAALRNGRRDPGAALLQRAQALTDLEHRDGGGYPDAATPDYDPQPHADDPGQLVCPHGSCADDACVPGDTGQYGDISCNGGCPVDGGAMNGPDAKWCDQCGSSLYSEDGTIFINSDGVPEEVSGDDLSAQALARNKAALALRQRQLAVLGGA